MSYLLVQLMVKYATDLLSSLTQWLRLYCTLHSIASTLLWPSSGFSRPVLQLNLLPHFWIIFFEHFFKAQTHLRPRHSSNTSYTKPNNGKPIAFRIILCLTLSQCPLKDHSFRTVLCWLQLCFSYVELCQVRQLLSNHFLLSSIVSSIRPSIQTFSLIFIQFFHFLALLLHSNKYLFVSYINLTKLRPKVNYLLIIKKWLKSEEVFVWKTFWEEEPKTDNRIRFEVKFFL